MIEVIDNFLNDDDFIEVFKSIEKNSMFPWYLNHGVVSEGDGHIQFTHGFYFNRERSAWFPIIEPILQKLKINDYDNNLIRVKSNLQHRTHSPITHTMHVDNRIEDTDEKTMTAIYYLNTNNGYTLFESGERIKSVANRLVMFPAKTMHSGTTNTDESNYRIVLNINWKKQ